MATINELIKNMRLAEGLSVHELAEGICTSKYIYLIEKGDRTPSYFILSQINKKFKVDLYELLRFLDTSDPVFYSKTYRALESASFKNDITEIDAIMDTLPEDNTLPIELKQFFMAMKGLLALYKDSDFKKCLYYIENGLALTLRQGTLRNNSFDHLTLSEGYLYVLLVSYTRTIVPEKNIQHELNTLINALIEQNIPNSNTLIFLLSLHQITIYMKNKQYKEILNYTERLNQRFKKCPICIYNMCYFQALAHFHLKNLSDSKKLLNIAFELSKDHNADNIAIKCQDLLNQIDQLHLIPISTHFLTDFEILTSDGQTAIGFKQYNQDSLIVDIEKVDNKSLTLFLENYCSFLDETPLPDTIFILMNFEDYSASHDVLDILTLCNAIELIDQKLSGKTIFQFRVFKKDNKALSQTLVHINKLISNSSLFSNFITVESKYTALKLMESLKS